MAISKFTTQSAKKDTGRTIGDNEVAKLANLNKIVTEVNTIFGGTANQLLAANGSSVSAGQNITISNGTISAAGGGGGSSFTLTTVGTLGTSALKWEWNSVVFPSLVAGTQILTPTSYPIITLGNFGSWSGTLSSITITDLTYLEMNINSIGTLVTIDFPDLTSIRAANMGASLAISSCASLTTVNIPSLNSLYDNGFFNFSGNAFSEATVDQFLVKFAATTAINGNLQLNGGTNASPSSTGLAAKATLQGRGWNVSTN